MDKQFWVVCYDIRDERRLRQVAKVMQRYGDRAQKSIFECWVDSGELNALLAAAREKMAPVDSLRCYNLCRQCQDNSLSRTGTETTAPKEFYIV